MSAPGIIYLITNTVNGKLYVGKTENRLEKRWRQHCANARHGSRYALHAAIRKYGVEKFTIEAVASVSPDFLDSLERCWIILMNSVCPGGYNLRAGGEGGKFTPEMTRKQVERTNTPEARRAFSEHWKAVWKNPEHRAFMKQAVAQRYIDHPEAREAGREVMNRRWADPEYRNSRNGPATRERMSAGQKARNTDPIQRAKLKAASDEYWAKPENRQKRSDLKKRQRSDPTTKYVSPEYREAHSNQMKQLWAARHAGTQPMPKHGQQ